MKVQEGLILVAIYFSLAYTQLVKGQPRKDCEKICGNVTIEYPFGTSPGCYYAEDPSFNITCDKKRGLIFGDNKVINISHSGELRIMVPTSYDCYNSLGNSTAWMYNIFTLGNLSLSDKNRFTAVGCDTYAFLRTYGVGNYSSGCMSVCGSLPEANGECTGNGCCQTSVPRGNKHFRVRPYSFDNHSSVYKYNNCSYAFLVENGSFHFNALEDLKNLRDVKVFPVVFDWSIGNIKCQQIGNKGICGGNSTCFDSIRGTGYNCKCFQGFHGNPYLSDGCKDINECTNPIHTHNCSSSSTCENTIGSFECNCPSGKDLNTTTMTCTLHNETPKTEPKYLGWTTTVLGTTIGFLLILLVVSFIQQRMKHQKKTKLRQKFFEQNGGGMLIQRLSGAGPSTVNVKIFTEEGMTEATDGYDDSRILGQGGQGTVYKGILPDNSIVAIKKARLGDCSQVEQFINEVIVLSQINHRNVVKLLDCCLETENPLLVYEFITNGTLFNHLHGSLSDSSLAWEIRLRIATEIAGTLAYLHSSASNSIIHRDIKTANILLDENFTAKVADFGASKLIPMDKDELATMVQGTRGYLDPEYHSTGLLNEKSDVYSFGVVLMELLSGKKALFFEHPQQTKHLVNYFVSATKENRLHEVIDKQVMNEDNQREIQEAARIALECTRRMGEERPKMKEVAAELDALKVKTTKQQWSDQYPEPLDIEQLLGVETLSAQGVTSSIKNVARLNTEAGR